MSMSDHFFGKVYRTRDGEADVPLYQAVPLARAAGAAHFTAQIRRLLGQHRYLVITDGTSAPEFPRLLQYLQEDQIGLVKLGLREDLSEGKNLTCSLVFVEGVVEVRACWTGYKELRALELAQTLLRPLWETGLANRTFLQQGDHETPLPTDPDEMFHSVMSFHGEPFTPSAHGQLQNYIDRINGVDPRTAWLANQERQADGQAD